MAKNIFDDFYCTSCGKKGIPIVRKAGAGRESGHLKKLYCIFCKRETNHVECQPFSHYNYEDFLCEFENGNFTEDGARKMTYGQLRAELNKEEMQQRKEERKKKEVSTNVISVDGLPRSGKKYVDS